MKKTEEDYIVDLPNLAVTPRGNYIDYTGEETFSPSLQEYMDAKAKSARIGAANHIVRQYGPNIPTVPRQTYETDDYEIPAYDSKIAGAFGMSDKDRIMWFGRDPNPETCLFTVTSQYDDKDAIASGNKTFRQNPSKYGFVGIPMKRSEVGDLIQMINDKNAPVHSVMRSGTTFAGEPTFSYSDGDAVPYTLITPVDTDFTMRRDKLFSHISHLGKPTAYRYIGSPSKQREWYDEYVRKYGAPAVDIPSHVEQPDALGVVKPVGVKALGGPLVAQANMFGDGSWLPNIGRTLRKTDQRIRQKAAKSGRTRWATTGGAGYTPNIEESDPVEGIAKTIYNYTTGGLPIETISNTPLIF